jgi:hypothetical protein
MDFVAVEEVLAEGPGDEIVPVVVRAEQAKHVGLDLQLGSVGPDIHADLPRVRLSRSGAGCGWRWAAIGLAPVPARSRLLVPSK